MSRVKGLHFFLVLFLLIHQNFAEELFEFLILHNNDMHGRFEETARNSGTCREPTASKTGRKSDKNGCLGGFGRTGHEIRKYRRLAQEGQGPPVIFLNAGDTYTGTAWFSVHKWKIAADFLNLLQPDVASFGNHEFDYGIKGIAPFLQSIKFPIVAANLGFDQEPLLKTVNKSVILEVSGRKIGVIGHLTPETKQIAAPGLIEFRDVVDSVRQESEILDKKGVKIIIALGHSGYEEDMKIAREVPLVDVVVGGHTNTFLWNGPQPDAEKPEDLYPKTITQKSGKKVPVVQAYAFTKYLGRLNVTFNEKGDLVDFQGQPELLDTEITQDADFLQLLDKYRPEVDALDKQVVGKTRVLLDATNNKCRFRECNFGNLMTDALVSYMATVSPVTTWTDVPIGLVNGGSIRNAVDARKNDGNVTRGELLGCFPFGNEVIAFQITGEDLWKTLEIGARDNGETSKGEFIQVSGLQVVYDFSKPSFQRVVSVKVRCGTCPVPIYEDIKLSRVYGVVSIGFLMNGGDMHFILRDKSTRKRTQDLSDLDILSWYIGKNSPVFPEESGRIQILETTVTSLAPSLRLQAGAISVLFVIIAELIIL